MKILITGISGTLGMAFTKYLVAHDHEVVGVDHNETSVASFKAKNPGLLVRVGDFADINVRGYDLLIHLGAMKHVDFCEENPSSCILNNVLKTYLVFQKANEAGTDIMFMSTDKAVEPISVYGYSKALGEAMTKELGGVVVRSGNITGSNGSVLEKWEEAITGKHPIKVTALNMKRYFISAEHLVERVWKKYLAGDRLIIPKMDQEVTLADLLTEKLASHGYSTITYPYGIIYTGLRPGEKIEEKLQ